jgi:surfactin synthase thioesterase subunit
LITVELPGRGAHSGDTAYSRMTPLLDDLIREIAPLLDRPYAFFGHSMGGMLAFELMHALHNEQHPMPVALLLSSTPGLATYTVDQVNPLMSDETLTNNFPHLKAARADEMIYAMLMHVLRADLTLICNYTYKRKDPLNIPLVVLHGQDDPRVTAAQARAWRNETTATCTIVPRPGDHRYITSDVPFVTARINDLLGATLSQPEYERIHT